MALADQFHDSNSEFIASVNDIICRHVNILKQEAVVLGPIYSTFSPTEAEENLQRLRFVSKFTIPSKSDKRRAQDSVAAMFDYDRDGLTDFRIGMVEDDYSRYQLNKARFALRQALKSFELDISNFDMPSGETFVSSNGNVSIYVKLKDINQWVCSPTCFDLFAQICYNSPGLKYAAKQHMKQSGIKYAYRNAYKTETPFAIFKAKLKKVITFNDISRITTVPKNADVDRVILCEPMCNMIVQRAIAKSLVKFINKTYKLDLYDAQLVHSKLISMAENATIDLRNASNSNWFAFIRWYLSETKLLPLLTKARIATVVYKDEYHHLNMIAPMGNGFTFEVMTLILLSITREFDSFSHVFGDDIIVHNEVAHEVVSLLECIGYVANEQKTYINSDFKESCGSFISHGKYLCSFDIKYATNLAEAIANVNKVHIMNRKNAAFVDVLSQLREATPVHLLGWADFDSDYVATHDRSMTKHLTQDVTHMGNFSLSSYVICSRSYVSKRVRKGSGGR